MSDGGGIVPNGACLSKIDTQTQLPREKEQERMSLPSFSLVLHILKNRKVASKETYRTTCFELSEINHNLSLGLLSL